MEISGLTAEGEKTTWEGRLEDYPLENYPDYEPGKPPRTEVLEQFSYLDELPRIWGKRWGSQGIGRLREVALVAPTEHETDPLWAKDPTFFLLRHAAKIDLDLLCRHHEAYAQTLRDCGVEVHLFEFEDVMGAYGPMRKLFIAGDIRVVRGGAIQSRFGHGSFKRGVEREMQRFLARIGCPIIYTVCGNGIFEAGELYNVAEDVMLTMLSNSANREGLEQVRFVLERCGVKEMHAARATTIMDSFESGGEFHIDMFFGVIDLRKAVIFPNQLDYETYKWLRSKGFELIEIPADEQQKYAPANLVLLEPGKVIMPKGAVETIRRVERAGVEVVAIDTEGIQHGGVNGVSCITGQLLRDPGPGLED